TLDHPLEASPPGLRHRLRRTPHQQPNLTHETTPVTPKTLQTHQQPNMIIWTLNQPWGMGGVI
ncbi:hypothetical protein, partial [Streptomyces sp. NPDC006341]|uniref:hypothetical protein n=1 Tax=Streptomyces sp. NPDC006341 TaxID=3156756 RepID=UPI0033AE3686